MRLFEIAGGTKFHGGFIQDKSRPVFFTDTLDLASNFVDLAPSPDGEFVVYEARISINSPAKIKDLRDAIKKTSSTTKDIESHFNDFDDSDFLLAPKVVSYLKQQGFDGYIGRGVLESQMINEYVVFDFSQITFVKTHVVE